MLTRRYEGQSLKIKSADILSTFVAELYLTDLLGKLQYFSVPSRYIKNGFESGFDGSSIKGFQAINESDMLLVPDLETAVRNPFTLHSTVMLFGNVKDPTTKEWYSRDPRFVAQKAEKFLQQTGIADTAFFGPEAEFFIFDKIIFNTVLENGCLPYLQVISEEAAWNTEAGDGHQIRHKEGYFPASPDDKTFDVRSEMSLLMEKMGIEIEKWHHEVATAGQAEIDMKYDTLVKMADKVQLYKFVVKNVARGFGKTATFMPKILLNDNGSGMHVHFSLWRGEQPLFADKKGIHGLSDMALYSIGGILKHAEAILAFAAPTINSYRRLVPGFEAPVNLAYSARNRSAAVRIPQYEPENPKATRFEFRCPDPSSNPYLVFSAMLMAAQDGIEHKIHPGKPLNKDIYHSLTDEDKKHVKSTPGSLQDSLSALNEDNKFLLKSNVFTADVINAYVKLKEKEIEEFGKYKKEVQDKKLGEKTTDALLAKEAEMYYNV